MADPAALMNAYDRFLAALPASTGNHLTMSLVGLRGLTSESMNAGGIVTIELAAGAVFSQVRGLPADGSFDLWFIKNRPGQGHTTMAEPQDIMLRIGAYQAQSGGTSFQLRWADKVLQGSSRIVRSSYGRTRVH